MSKLGFRPKDNYTRCKNSAIYSLAMREHSRKELHDKLKTKEYVEGVDIDELLNELEENNYLNEERFVESYIRYRASRGFGSVKISSELQLRGITSSTISIGLKDAEADWYQIAENQQGRWARVAMLSNTTELICPKYLRTCVSVCVRRIRFSNSSFIPKSTTC